MSQKFLCALIHLFTAAVTAGAQDFSSMSIGQLMQVGVAFLS